MNKFRLLYRIILTYGDKVKEMIYNIKEYYRNNVFWSKGYFINSIGNASEDTIRDYINNQG